MDGARLRLLEQAPTATLKDLLTATLDLAEELTGSRIGFLHFVDDDQRTLWLQAWSTNTVAGMCTAEGAGSHYPIDRAGVWADCVRTGRPVVHDDYASAPGKKGMPPGHAQVIRELTVPVVRSGRVCAVLGVGNKPSAYEDADVADVSSLADLAWDIAARKRAEEALHVQQTRLALAATSGKLGLWDLDLATNVAWRTLQHDRLFGYEELQPSWGPEDALRHVVPEDRPIFRKAFEEALVTGHFHYELRIHSHDQTLRWIEADGEVSRDAAGRPDRIRGTVVDVTERKRAEAALRESELRYRTLAHHFPRGIVGLFDGGLRMILVDGSHPVLDADPSSVLGKRPSEFAAPDTARRMEEAFREALAGTPAQFTIRARDRIIDVSTYPVRDDLGTVIQGLIMTEDVTEREALRSRLALTSRLEAMGTLVAGVVHEVNNPLAAELADQGIALEIVRELRERLRGDDPIDRAGEVHLLGDAIEALEEAQEGGRRIARIVKNLSTFGRPDSRHARVRLGDVVSQAMRWLPATVAQAATVQVEDGGAPEVVASIGQLEQVVVHLVTNAARAIPAGRRGLVVVRMGPGTPGMSRLDVVDDGRGIEPAFLERIFEPFFTTRPAGAGRGMGLGLAICHTIVTSHRGTLTVTSAPGKGSTFRMELPAAPPEA